MTKIRFELSAKPSKHENIAQGKSGFVPVTTRWVIERSLFLDGEMQNPRQEL
ncbi:hypothetical protein [Nostoc mirabile]|uniref:hypothetical protein n=1 Tax=Nostoc mirabile TaxID=2907820 RepID=UPI003555C7E3